MGDKATGSRRRFFFSRSPRGTSGEGRAEGKALKTLVENELVFPGHPSPSLSRNTASRAATSRGAPDWRKRSVRFSLSSGRGLG